ncbi:hypothetical protein JCM1840_005247 [Sporobolomyces johnsonii]
MSLYKTIAPVLCGAYVSCTSCGVVFLLCVSYFHHFWSDRLLLKLFVVSCLLYCMADTAVDCSWAYNWAVTSFGNAPALTVMPWQLGAFGILTSQLFFCHRIWVVSGRKNWSIVAPTVLLSLIPLGLACYMASWCATHDAITDFAHIRGVTNSWLALVLVIDVILTGALVNYMYIKPTVVSSPFENIFLTLAETNAFAVIVHILYLAMYAAYPDDYYYTVFGFSQVKTGLGSIIAILIGRTYSSGGMDGSSSFPESRNKGLGALSRQQQSVQVTVQHQVNVEDFDKFNDELNPGREYANPHGATEPYKVQFHLPGLAEGPRDIESGKVGNGREEHEAY